MKLFSVSWLVNYKIHIGHSLILNKNIHAKYFSFYKTTVEVDIRTKVNYNNIINRCCWFQWQNVCNAFAELKYSVTHNLI